MEKEKVRAGVVHRMEGIEADAEIVPDIIEEIEIEDLTVDGICGVY